MKKSNSTDTGSDQGPEILKVGKWSANRRTLRIEDGTNVLVLEPKVMDLLFALAAAPGEVLDRDELTRRLWPNVHVTPDSLTRLVSKLRSALGDDPRQPATIETVSKRGYRLIADVKADSAAPTQPERKHHMAILFGALAAAILVIVVLIAIRPESRLAEEQRLKSLSEIDRVRAADRANQTGSR